MKLTDAKARILTMIERDLRASGAPVLVDPRSPDPSDEAGKFMLAGMPARVVQRFSGWHVYIALDWFDELWSFPRIQQGEFYWYVFHLPAYGPFQREHYFICDFKQMRDWVMEFAAVHPGQHRDHRDWMAAFQSIEGSNESLGYFRWGDEPAYGQSIPSRVIGLDNAAVLAEQEHHVGPRRLGGESEAHRLLKLYVAERPHLLGLSPAARPTVEHTFLTGDRVDVLFDNHGPRRSVVEIELDGERNLEVGVHQAIKYRALAAAADRFALADPTVRAYVAAFETRYTEVEKLAHAYDVHLVSVDRSQVLRRVA